MKGIFFLLFLLFTFQALGNQYALIVITDFKSIENRSVSHVSLYKNKELCSNKLRTIKG